MKYMVFFLLMFFSAIGAPQDIQNNNESESEGTSLIFDEDLLWLFIAKTVQYQISVIDQVEDGCWTSINSSKNVIELELRRSNYSVINKEEAGMFTPIIVLAPLGYATNNNTCAVVVQLIVFTFDVAQHANANDESDARISSWFHRELYSGEMLLTGPKSSMSQRVKDTYQELIQGYLVQIDRNVEDIRQKVNQASEGKYIEYWDNYFNENF